MLVFVFYHLCLPCIFVFWFLKQVIYIAHSTVVGDIGAISDKYIGSVVMLSLMLGWCTWTKGLKNSYILNYKALLLTKLLCCGPLFQIFGPHWNMSNFPSCYIQLCRHIGACFWKPSPATFLVISLLTWVLVGSYLFELDLAPNLPRT